MIPEEKERWAMAKEKHHIDDLAFEHLQAGIHRSWRVLIFNDSHLDNWPGALPWE